jgi:hypothetical protein
MSKLIGTVLAAAMSVVVATAVVITLSGCCIFRTNGFPDQLPPENERSRAKPVP